MELSLSLDRTKQLTLLILVLAIAGLAGIYFAIENIKPIETKIDSIEDSLNGRIVRINGMISNIKKSKSGNFYWTVDDGSNITVPILDSKFKSLAVKKGDTVEVVGVVTKYNGELEVMPREIYTR